MENKTKLLTNEEILRQQLELLAERSKKTHNEVLPALTHAMVEIMNCLK